MTKSADGFASPVSFATCSFIRPNATDRKKMVVDAVRTWPEFLDLPFAERIFLDDHSPDFAASRLLASTGVIERFDRVQYWPVSHPTHSNYGIVACMALAHTPYILHLDDDVFIKTSARDCHTEIARLVEVLEDDPSILGVNLLDLRSSDATDWKANEVYPKAADLHYPNRYFGTAACLVRRSLLDVVTFEQIAGWGNNQPEIWEKLVSEQHRERFLITARPPFVVRSNSYFVNAAGSRSVMDTMIYRGKRGLRRMKRAARL